MTRFWLVFLMFPASVNGAPCAPGSPGPCLPDADTKSRISREIRAAVQAYSKMVAERNLAAAALQAGDTQAAVDHYEAAAAHETELNSKAAEAISSIQEGYHIAPAAMSGKIRGQRDPSGHGSWVANIPATWEPKVKYGGETVRAITAPDRSIHYVAAPKPDKADAFTDPDGRVFVHISALIAADAASHPGALASAIHHEAIHFGDKLTRVTDSIQREELRAFKLSRRHADVFELSTVVKGKQDQIIAAQEAAIRAQSYTYPVLTPEQERANQAIHVSEKKSVDELAQGFETARKELEETRRIIEEIARRQIPEPIPIRPDPETARGEPVVPGSGRARSIGFEGIPPAMLAIAKAACATPPAEFSAKLDWMPWDEFNRLSDLHFISSGLSGCELAVFNRLAVFGGAWRPPLRISVSEVMEVVGASRAPQQGGGGQRQTPDHDPVWKKIGVPKR